MSADDTGALEAIRGNCADLTDRIGAAAARAGRRGDDISVVTVDTRIMRLLPEAGIADIGENRVRSALEKREKLADLPFTWHMIGHLQRNKAKRALDFADVIHSVESPKLLAVLERECAERERKLDVFFEVSISGEEAKYGVLPDEAKALAEKAYESDFINVRGLMTMAPFVGDPEETRPIFAGLRELRERLIADGDLAPDARELSMGMTNDYEVAVEEGATTIRIGTYIFKGVF